MFISKVTIYQSPVKLKEPFIISLGPVDYAANIVVVIRTNTGLTGYGECSPFLTINGESMETGFIVGQYLAKVLVGKNPLDIEGCTIAMDRVIYGNSSIKSAFDIALYDIAAQNAGLPLYKFLGGANNKTIVTDYTISIGSPEKMATDAKKMVAAVFNILKVKVGGSKEEDVERIRKIREAIGNEILLRLDANQGWDTNTSVEILKSLAPYNIQYCEEPIARWNYMELPKVKAQSPISVMADECCCNHHDAERLIQLKACDYFNIKLGKSGGIFKALKIIRLAEAAGIRLQIGGFLESRLGFTASAHLALCSNYVLYYDFDTPLMFTEDPVTGGITYKPCGVINVPDSIGLGAMVSETYLDELKKAEIGG
jgi:L-alanine-DL-glutamate epimerase-like enolase superfamily enzyme